jgi:hypothetical protein
LLRTFAALLAGANGLSPLRFLIFNAAGGTVWATVFGLGGYLLGKSIRRIAGPFGWAALIAAIVFALVLRRYYKKNEERLLAEAKAATASGPDNNRAERWAGTAERSLKETSGMSIVFCGPIVLSTRKDVGGSVV